jgi:CHAT domain-containing protein
MRNPPNGIIHFCGHGFAPSRADRRRFAILLEDGELDLMSWQGMTGPRLTTHPFFFFNACDIGRTKRVADFVDGWAPAALELGAAGYVGALWPIQDDGAAAFAASFYAELAKQMQPAASIATVLRNTRASRLAKGDATGLAYAFYGDPHLRVRSSQ